MMNKKAIAAFAAGATLLAGFAMATPAMAAPTCPAPAPLKSVAKTAADAAYTAYDEANTVLKGMTVSEDATGAVPTITPAAGKTVAAYYNVNADTTIELFDKAIKADIKEGEAGNLRAFAAKRNAHVASLNAYNAQKSKVAELLQKWVDAKYVLEHCATPDPTKDELNRAEIKKVYDAKQAKDNKEDILNKKQKAFDDAFKALKAATAEFKARKAAVDAAQDAIDKFEASGVTDSATLQKLNDALKRANAHYLRATTALGDAQKAYDDALSAVKKAVSDYNDALAEYKRVYNEAVAMGINPDDLPPVVTDDPLDPKFPTVPDARDLYSKSLKGEFGKAVQQAAQKAEAGKNAPAAAGAQGAPAAAGAAAGKAGAAAGAAKGELAGMGAKGGHGKGKAGEQLGNAGVGVALTALAASMLAGMGAAVRKMRH
ncbi:hypothetical protein ACJV45_05425 [Gardnerella sp. Marseille-Q9181]|uniref:hypothetical protein n=1 Tax=Gardnerella sp. Marseille-Q9181 TaxID=3383029 RepID=UPI003AF67143